MTRCALNSLRFDTEFCDVGTYMYEQNRARGLEGIFENLSAASGDIWRNNSVLID